MCSSDLGQREMPALPPVPETACAPRAAFFAVKERVPFDKAAGRIAAEQVMFCDRSLVSDALESDVLRPAAQVYFADALQDPEGLHEYLSAHESPITVADLRAGVMSSA